MSHDAPPDPGAPDLAAARGTALAVRDRLRRAILGREDVIDLVVVALLAGGHVLLEDFPGSGKTMLARALGAALEPAEDGNAASFRRIQFTPDLLPSDITGVTIFEPESGTFRFQPGPVFAHVVLADEINRTSPKVQAALLEAMAERQVTVDNVTHPLPEPFLVIATQNPLGLAGTFPLPAPQLDRFLFKVRMDHIDREAELAVLESWRERIHPSFEEGRRVTPAAVLAARRAIEEGIHVAPAIREALVDLARAVREDPRVSQGLSTRAILQAIPALGARALLAGRDWVAAEDLEELLVPLFAHRLALAAGVRDPEPVLRDAAARILDRLAASTLRP